MKENTRFWSVKTFVILATNLSSDKIFFMDVTGLKKNIVGSELEAS